MPRDLSDALEVLVEATEDPSLCTIAMDAVAEATGAYGAALFPLRGQFPKFPYSRSLDPRNGGEKCAAIEVAKNGFPSELDSIAPWGITRYPYYRAFLAPHRLRWFAGAKIQVGDDLWYLSIQRTIDQSPFSLSDERRIADLSKELAGVLGFARTVLIAQAEGALAAFEATNTAVTLLDGYCKVWGVNPAAKRLFGPDLNILNRRLVSADRAATAALDRALLELLWAPETAARRQLVQLPRQNKRPIIAYLLPFLTLTSHPFSPCQAVVVLIDLERRNLPAECHLRACFELTAAETSLARLIASGEHLNAICSKRGITAGTARTQLRSVFAKMSVHRQSEMVALLGNLATLLAE